MNIVNWIILVVGFCVIPAVVLRLCQRFSLLGKIGPVLLLYGLGIIIGNIGLMPEQMPAVQELLSNAMVPLAIPLMLFGCTFNMKGGEVADTCARDRNDLGGGCGGGRISHFRTRPS